jgi:hypothetical protein
VLDEATEVAEPHDIEDEMENAEVNEDRRDEAPDLAATDLGKRMIVEVTADVS